MTPNSARVAELYSLAAAGDMDARIKLGELYADFIAETGAELQLRHYSVADPMEIKIAGLSGIGNSLEKLGLSANCPTYAAWVEKNIRLSIQRLIFKTRGII